MKTMIGLTLFLFGTALLVMVGGVSNARREEATDIAWIWFVGDNHLFRFQPDIRQQITVMPRPRRIRLSPDGKWIYYTTEGSIFRRQLVGDTAERLTDMRKDEEVVAWSPDQNWMAIRVYDNGRWQLYRMKPDGSELVPLGTRDIIYEFLSISPDSEWIYLTIEQSNSVDLVRMRNDGRDEAVLATNIRVPKFIGWSADTNWLLIEAQILAGARHIFGINALTGGFERITNGGLDHTKNILAPNRESIIYAKSIGQNYSDLYQFAVSSRESQNLTEGPQYESFIAWFPDSKRIVYAVAGGSQFTLVVQSLEDLTRETVAEPLSGYVPYSGKWIAGYDCLIYSVTQYNRYDDYVYLTCLDSGTTYQFGSSGTDTILSYWSEQGDWGIVQQYDTTSAALYRIALGRDDMNPITPQFSEIGFVGATPIVEREWNVQHLTIIRLAMLGGSLCVGYWFSRS